MTTLPKGSITFLAATTHQPLNDLQIQTLTEFGRSHGALLTWCDKGILWVALRAPFPAVNLALAIQRHAVTFAAAESPFTIAIHRGPVHEHNGRYSGDTLNRAASILMAGHPGQILLSDGFLDLIEHHLPSDVVFRDLGTHRLKDLMPPLRLLQLQATDLPSTFPPLLTLDRRPHNLPILLTPLIGRERELAEIDALLWDPRIRLVTIQGASGTGKTRLALQAAVEQRDTFRDGVYVIALAPVTDPSLVFSEIARTLEIREEGTAPILSTLQKALASKQLLLILDNFEQVVSVAPQLSELLRAAPRLKILITSQIACDLAEEHVLTLPPLALPSEIRHYGVKTLSQIPSVALFVARARAVQPRFVLDESNAVAVVELCQRLEGLPLAIELVAAQSRRYLPRDMVVLLHNHLAMARVGQRRDSRQDILSPVLDWICTVLGAPVAAFFARLGVFDGGCTVESAQPICNPENELGLDVQATLNMLLDHHLLLREERIPGHVRYTMLDSVHEYARQRLIKRREIQRFQQLHAAYYADLVEQAAPQLMGGGLRECLIRLSDTIHNIRAALAWSDSGNPVILVRMCGALTRFWFLQGLFAEGRMWLACALPKRVVAPLARQGDLFYGEGLLAYAQSDCETALEHLEASLSIRQTLDDTPGMITVLNYLGNTASNQHRIEQAIDYYTKAMDMAQDTGNITMQATLMLNIGVLYYYEADFDYAWNYFAQCLTLHQHIDNPFGRAIVINNLGLIAYHQGDFSQATALLRESQGLAHDLNNKMLQAETLSNLARVSIATGDGVGARAMLEEALRLRVAQGDRHALALTLEPWAELAAFEGQPSRALRIIAMSHALFYDVGTTLTPLALQQRAKIEAMIKAEGESDGDLNHVDGVPAQMPLEEIMQYVVGWQALQLA